MFGVSRLTALILAFCLGIVAGAGVFAGGISIALSMFTIRDLDNNNIIPIPDETIIGADAQVDLLNLTAFQLFDEYQALQKLGDDFTYAVAVERYDLQLPQKIERLFSDESIHQMPMKKLLSEDGLNAIFATVYIGEVEGYECWDSEGNTNADPSSPDSFWVDPDTGKRISAIEEKIADWSIASFMAGDITVDSIIGDFTIGDMLGYSLNDNNEWVDGDGNKATGIIASFAGSKIDSIDTDINEMVIGDLLGYEKDNDGIWWEEDGKKKITGVMAVFAPCKMNEVAGRMNTALLGELLGYESKNGVWYDADGNKITGAMSVFADETIDTVDNAINTTELGKLLGYEYDANTAKWLKDDGAGNLVPVHGFMNVVAGRTVNNVDGIMDELTIGDIIPEDKRTGFVGLLDPDTKFDGISEEVNEKFNNTSMRTLIENGVITFDTEDAKQKFLNSSFADKNISELLSAIAAITP